MNEKEAKRLSLELMRISEAVYVTTLDTGNCPDTRAMCNLRNSAQYTRLSEIFDKHKDDFVLYFSTNTSSLKVQQILENPVVSVYFCTPSNWLGLQLRGEMEIVTDRTIKEELWQDGWEVYYPEGTSDPEYSILKLLPKTAKYYHQLTVVEFKIGVNR